MDFLEVPSTQHAWILNTPERQEILNEGPPKQAHFNLLGKGAFGTVFKAVFRERPVALKIVKNRKGINRTENEANILGWYHRNIVRILMIESTTKFGIIIMEHFPSQSLQTILEAIDLPLIHRVHILLDILNALQYCHNRNLLHLDVKPQNVLVAFGKHNNAHSKNETKTTKNRIYICKLCDFGSSLKISDQQLSIIKTGGTIRYMSPEALRAEHLTPAADIYTLGITMWQLQQRRAPYNIIQCNEVVAFQVVKHNLRPNSDLKKFLMTNPIRKSPSPRSEKCICQCFTTASSGYLRKRLKFDTPLKRGCYSARKDISLTLSISPNEKAGKSIQILDSNAIRKVARDLSKDLELQQTEKELDFENLLNLAIVFKNISNWSKELLILKESNYTKIYELCWQTETKDRPGVKKLKSMLKKLLERNMA